MRIGVIGCGSIGTRHVGNLLAMGHDVLVFDPNPAAEIPGGAKRRGTLRELLYGRSDVNAVMICSPASTHAVMASSLRSVSYCGPLFVEKPLALSTAECEIFRQWPSPVTMVGYNWRHNFEAEQFWRIHKAADRLELLCATNMATWPGRHYAAPLLECSHEIDLALHWLGPMAALKSAALYSGGAFVGFSGDGPAIEVFLSWCVDDSSVGRRYFARTTGRPSAYRDMRQEWVDKSYLLEVDHFLARVATNKATLTPFADGIRVLEVIEQAQQLAKGVA